jgi:hypothetical protein
MIQITAKIQENPDLNLWDDFITMLKSFETENQIHEHFSNEECLATLSAKQFLKCCNIICPEEKNLINTMNISMSRLNNENFRKKKQIHDKLVFLLNFSRKELTKIILHKQLNFLIDQLKQELPDIDWS